MLCCRAVQELARMGIECVELKAYVEGREAALREVTETCGVSREAAKGLFLAICFGGGIAAWAREHDVDPGAVPKSVAALQGELRAAMAAALRLHPDAARAAAQQARKNPDAQHPRATQFAYIMQDVERRCLEALTAAVCADGRLCVGALIHDGLLVGGHGPSLGALPELEASQLGRWEAAVEAAAGYRVHLAVKA